MDDLFLPYVLNTLTPAERAAVEAHFAARPEAAEEVEFIRRAVAPLAADRDGYDPPRGLAAAAVARTAEYLVAHGLAWAADSRETLKPGTRPPMPAAKPAAAPAPTSELDPLPVVPASGAPSSPARPAPPREASGPVYAGWWRRPDAIVATLIAFLAGGMVVTAIGKVREGRNVVACQDRLREMHQALVGYSEVRDGRFPQVGTPPVPTAGAFADELARAGHLPPGLPVACPVAPAAADASPFVTPVRYTYTLGYYGPGGNVVGLRRGEDPGAAEDGVPILADLPAVGGEAAHARGQNVLFVGGAVRYATTPAAGPNGDDIYHNEAGLTRAGFHLLDASLGRPADRP